MLNVQIAFFSIAARVTSRSGTGYAMRYLYSSRVVEAADASKVVGQMRATKHWLTLMADLSSTVCTAALYTFGSISRASCILFWEAAGGGRGVTECLATTKACRPSAIHLRLSPVDGISAYDPKTIWMSALDQALTVMVCHVALTVVDWKFHGVNHFAAWPTSPTRFVSYMLLLMTVGGSKIAVDTMELLCPTVGQGGKVLLSYCNTRSLFDKM